MPLESHCHAAVVDVTGPTRGHAAPGPVDQGKIRW
jgi:hypothetical protein